MVLETQQGEKFHIFFDQFDASLVLHGTAKVLVTREQDSLGQKHLSYIKKRWMTVHIESNFVQNVGFLGNELVLFAVETQLMVILAMKRIHTVHIYLLIAILLSLAWLVPRQLPQKLPRARHMWIFLIIFGCDKQTTERLQHDEALVHLLLV